MKLFRAKKHDQPGRRLSDQDVRPVQTDMSTQFRRNRTLSGVRRPGDASSSTRSQVHHLTIKRQRVGSIFLLVLIGIALLGLLITQLTARVIVVGSTKAITSAIDAPKYEKVINDYLGIHPADRLRFILNDKALSDYASSITPEVSTINQSGSENVVDTHFTITFRSPVAGWQINGHQYYVDDQGIVFEKNYYAAPQVQIVDESGISPEQGSTVASTRFLSFVGRVVALSKDSGYEVTQAILPSGTTRELEVRIKDVQPLVKLSIDRGAGEQVQDMVTALKYLASKGQNPGYVDVRISGRAAYQ